MEPYRHQELEMFENQEIHDLNFQQCPEKSPKSKRHQLNHPERQKIYFQAIPLLLFLKYRLQIAFPPSTMWNQHIKHVDYPHWNQSHCYGKYRTVLLFSRKNHSSLKMY